MSTAAPPIAMPPIAPPDSTCCEEGAVTGVFVVLDVGLPVGVGVEVEVIDDTVAVGLPSAGKPSPGLSSIVEFKA
jgi:hypothetical protein